MCIYVYVCVLCVGMCTCIQVPVEVTNKTSDTLAIVTGFLM